MSLEFFVFFYCKHISSEDVDSLSSFTVRKGGGFLANYLVYEKADGGSVSPALNDEEMHNARVYLVVDKETNEIAGYFALKAGYIAVHPSRKLFSKEFDTVPGVELANFAVNDSYIKNHQEQKGLGAAIFKYCVLPIARDAQDYIGIRFIYIFFFFYAGLIKRYQSYGFSRLSRLQEKSTHKLIRPRYDRGCIFMYQTL